MKKLLTRRNLIIFAASLSACCLLVFIVALLSPDPDPSTITPTVPERSLATTDLSTNTVSPPTITNTLIPPTKTLPPSPTSTATITPTETSRSVDLKPTITVAISGACNCNKDYDCKDFPSRSAAQACFTSCGGSKTKNWSRLDNDHDGRVCEN